MASIHIQKAQAKARAKGGYAGTAIATEFWDLSKRELVELVLRLGEVSADVGGLDNAVARVHEEYEALRNADII